MTELQAAMSIIIGVFHKHAGEDQRLNKAELKGLLESQFRGALGDTKDKNTVDEIFKDLDHDGSGSVDFIEFVTLVASLTATINEIFTKK